MPPRLHRLVPQVACAGFLLLSGCVLSGGADDPSLLCEEDPTCPDGYTCVAGSCVPDTGGGGGGGADGGGDLDPSEYAYRVQLTFGNQGRGALDDFPVLVALTAETFSYGDAKADGSDIAFSDADGAALPHEIDTWAQGGDSLLWVRVPRIDENSDTDSIWMYYGNPEATVAQNSGAVWSAYRGVYHLAGAAGDDSSASGYDGDAVGTVATDGMVGQGAVFDGATSRIDLGTERDFGRAVDGVTIEGWLQPSAAVIGVAFAASIGGGTASRIQIRQQADLVLEGGARSADEGSLLSADGGALTVGQWTWVVASIDFADDSIRIYFDGAEVSVATALGFADATPDTASAQAVIGSDEDLASNFFPGLLDEVRVAHDASSPDWVSAQYASMTEALISFGTPEAL